MMSRLSQRQVDDIADNRARSGLEAQATPWECQTCRERVDEMSPHILEKKYGKEYADQTNLTPCKCIREFLEK
jgi:hypothetical protein